MQFVPGRPPNLEAADAPICSALESLTIRIGVEILYLLIAYSTKPRPDASNIGRLRGLIDSLCCISHDRNRILLLLVVCLLPGPLPSVGVVHTVRPFRSALS